MLLSKADSFEIPAAFDAHVHLRQDEMMDLVVPTIREGGASTVYVSLRSSHQDLFEEKSKGYRILLQYLKISLFNLLGDPFQKHHT